MGLEKLPKIFKQKVDTTKVQLPVIRKWISEEIDKYLQDDDIVAEYLAEMVEANDEPNIVEIHNQMVDFLGPEDALIVCSELWKMLLSAQQDKDGVPEKLVEREKQRRREEALRVDAARQRQSRERNTSRKDGWRKNQEYRGSTGDSYRSGSDKRQRVEKDERKRTNYNRSRSKSPTRRGEEGKEIKR